MFDHGNECRDMVVSSLDQEIEELKAELSKMSEIVQYADCYSAVKPEHRLFESMGNDLRLSIKRYKEVK